MPCLFLRSALPLEPLFRSQRTALRLAETRVIRESPLVSLPYYFVLIFICSECVQTRLFWLSSEHIEKEKTDAWHFAFHPFFISQRIQYSRKKGESQGHTSCFSSHFPDHKQPSRESFVHPAMNFSYELFLIRPAKPERHRAQKNFNSPGQILVARRFCAVLVYGILIITR